MTAEILVHAMIIVLVIDTALATIIFGGEIWK